MKESVIENAVVKMANGRGVISLKLNLMGNRGWPDRLFLIPGGKPLFIEFKRPGVKARKLQEYRHAQLRELGYQVELHDSARTALRSISKALEAGQVHGEGGDVADKARSGWTLPRPWPPQD